MKDLLFQEVSDSRQTACSNLHLALALKWAEWQQASANRNTRTWLLLLVALAVGLCTAFPALSHGDSPSALGPSRIVQFLDQTISWYRQTDLQQQLVSDASDAVFVNGNQQTANEVVRLVFQFARDEAKAMPPPAGNPSGSSYASLMQRQAKAEQEAKQVQGEVEDLRRKLRTAVGKKRQDLQAQLEETQSEVALAQARAEAMRNMTQFINSAATGTNGLSVQIDALASTVPAELTEEPGATSNAPRSSEQANPRVPATEATVGSGLWDEGKKLFSTLSKRRNLEELAQQTQALSRSAREMRSPMENQLRQLIQRGDQLAQEADTADAATLAQEKTQLDVLTKQFNQLTAAILPSAKVRILLNLYQENLANWRTNVTAALLAQLRSLFVRGLVLVAVFAGVLGASELWRRAIHRYVRDLRRRSQLQWMRKFVVWFAMGTLLAFSFVGQLGSIATFAGLLTAGIAVALQNVIQSVVGYFFLIGKYGIRPGDRVQIGGVTGEVIDVGLVRIHVMEMGGLGDDAPTGRVVAFSNSLVFQATAGLFKQIPGTNFAWHEITFTLPAETNFASVRESLMKAVASGLADYKEEISRQHSAIQNTFEATRGAGLEPTVQLRFTGLGFEAKVRYPVTLRHASEIDERVMRELLNVTQSGSPAFHLKTTAVA